ncbi:MAG: 2-hydroxyacid dehydrogenase [Lachnospiraceae bacterium]|nr:2-hydroxyacid dehydrogenase [Lachnospiraceae bacterium]
MNITFFGTKSYDRIWFSDPEEQSGFSIRFLEVNLSKETVALAEGAEAVCVFVNDTVDAVVMERLAKLGVKAILLRCAGYNQVDLTAAKKHGIRVFHVPGYSPEAVAEFAMGLLLSVNRQIPRAYMRTRFFNMDITGLMGRDLHGMTAGVVGTGKIGQAMIRILKGFGMRILAYDIYPSEISDVTYVSLEELFRQSDVITMHCPLTRENYHMINRDSLTLMKEGVFLMNTSRGALIDARDLVDALLISGKIGGVGLDVYEEEGDIFYEDRSNDIIKDDVLARLMTFPNVIITSHQGYFTREALQAIAETTMENAMAAASGDPSPNEIALG